MIVHFIERYTIGFSQERSPQMWQIGDIGQVSRETWASTLLSYLMLALSNEVAGILGLPREDVSDAILLCNLSFDSLSLKRFQQSPGARSGSSATHHFKTTP